MAPRTLNIRLLLHGGSGGRHNRRAAVYAQKTGGDKEKSALRPPRSAFLVGSDVAVDQIAHVVVVFLLLLKECVVFGAGSVILDVDVVDRRLGCLFVAGLGFFQRHNIDPLRRCEFGVLLVLLRGRADALGAEDEEDRSAFRADDRILVEIEEFRAAVLTLPLGAEFRLGQSEWLPQAEREISSAPLSGA